MKIEITTITPEIAAKLLVNNHGNRLISRAAVKRYAAAMREGRWELNGEPIQVSVEGALLNGQHRLLACESAGVSFQTVFITGVSRSAQDTMDTGKKRGPAGQLQIDGVPNANATAAAIRQIYAYLTGEAHIDTQTTKAFLQRYADITDYVSLALAARDVVATSVSASVLWLGGRTNAYELKTGAFIAPLANGEGLEAGDPRLALRNALINAKIVNKGHAPRQDYMMAVTSHAWNAFVGGRKVSHVKAYATKSGRFELPPIAGAPKPLSGIESLETRGRAP